MQHKFLALVSFLALAGCASYVDKPYQMVTVVTPGVSGADCVLETRDNKFMVLTPGKVRVERAEDTLDVTCNKVLYNTAHKRVESKVTLGRSAWGTVLGMAYDTANESVYTYPDVIEVQMEPNLYDMVANAADEDPVPPPPQKKIEPEPDYAQRTQPYDDTVSSETFSRSSRK
ncbi:MAG: hypothetical protein OXT65_11860 [Alphaproteobacteria bacterium]|nr:hypothetical protein [Alphaproteobacteria bacterium]